MAKPNCKPTTSNPQVSRSELKPDAVLGLMNLNSIKQMFFCIAQSDDSAHELDSYSLLGISNIMEASVDEVEQAYNAMIDAETRHIHRHNKLRADIAAYMESDQFLSKSALAQILADDEKEVNHANS